MFPREQLNRDMDRVRGSGLHMNWGDCQCSMCSGHRVVAELRETLDALDRVRALCDDFVHYVEGESEFVTDIRRALDGEAGQ